jgi:hypothetical protein
LSDCSRSEPQVVIGPVDCVGEGGLLPYGSLIEISLWALMTKPAEGPLSGILQIDLSSSLKYMNGTGDELTMVTKSEFDADVIDVPVEFKRENPVGPKMNV